VELILIRHAEPAVCDEADPSSADPPLAARGRAQAKALADWLAREDLDCLVSSPARRARETAAAIADRSGLDVEVDDRLRDAGPDGGPYRPIEAAGALDRAALRARVEAYGSGPGLVAISRRVNQALDERCARHPGGRVVVCCHGSVVNLYAARVLGLADPLFLETAYASAHRFMISRGGVRSVRSLNETAYL